MENISRRGFLERAVKGTLGALGLPLVTSRNAVSMDFDSDFDDVRKLAEIEKGYRDDFQRALDYAVEEANLQGGYFFVPKENVYLQGDIASGRNVPFYLDVTRKKEGRKLVEVPSKKEIKKQILYGTHANFDANCGWEEFETEEGGLTIDGIFIKPDFRKLKSDLEIKEMNGTGNYGEVNLTDYLKINLSIGENEHVVESLSATRKTDLFDNYETAKKMTERQEENLGERHVDFSDLLKEERAYLSQQYFTQKSDNKYVIVNNLRKSPFGKADGREIFSFAFRLD